MQRLTTFFAVCCIASMLLSQQTTAQVLDSIVALVNADIILQSDVTEYRAITEHQRNARTNGKAAPSSISESDLLDDLIIRTIQLSKAEEIGIRISDNQLNQMLAEEVQSQGRNPEDIISEYASFPGGLNAYRRFFRNNAAIQELQRVAIRSSISVTELDARHFLTTEQGRSQSRLIYQLAFVSMPTATLEEAGTAEVLEEVTQFFRQDVAFDQQLDQMKMHYPWIDGKLLEPRAINNLPTIFADIAPLLSQQEIYNPIYDGDKVYLVKAVRITGAQPQLQDMVRARHILLDTSIVRNEQQVKLLLNALRQRIANGESFDTLARTYTEDQGSKNNGGDLDWQFYTFFTPSFADQLQNLALLELSRPFQTPFGWHVAQVIERRQEDVSEKREIDTIRNYLFQQKINDELPRWLNQLRESSYIEIRNAAPENTDLESVELDPTS